MTKQTFTSGQVLTAAQMTSLQQTAMLGGSASAKTDSYVLVAADAGTAITMSKATSTTITVNTGLFAAGDTVTILNVGAGVCTITAGTATVSKPTNATLALVQNAGGILYFTATGAATFMPFDVGAGSSGKVLQVVSTSYNTSTSNSSGAYADTGLSVAITPSAATSKVLILVSMYYQIATAASSVETGANFKLLRGSTGLAGDSTNQYFIYYNQAAITSDSRQVWNLHYLDSPSTTSATTYKIQSKNYSQSVTAQYGTVYSQMTAMEIGA